MSSVDLSTCTSRPCRQRRRLSSRLTMLLVPSRWTHKVQVTVSASPPETPLRSVLNATNIPDNNTARPSPTFIEPNHRPSSDLRPRRRPAPLMARPTSLRSSIIVTPRSASDSKAYLQAQDIIHDSHIAPAIPRVSVECVPHHRRTISTPSTGVWLCSPPSGKRAERPLIVRSSSTKSNETRAKEADARDKLADSDCMAVHCAVTSRAAPTERSPRRSLDLDLAPGIYRLQSQRPDTSFRRTESIPAMLAA